MDIKDQIELYLNFWICYRQSSAHRDMVTVSEHILLNTEIMKYFINIQYVTSTAAALEKEKYYQ